LDVLLLVYGTILTQIPEQRLHSFCSLNRIGYEVICLLVELTLERRWRIKRTRAVTTQSGSPDRNTASSNAAVAHAR
ncbi:MAG: hypothetical protein ACRD7E_10505, partial [Bryobacteraceae bacterium]